MVKLDSDFIIGTTRFNEITAKENRVWREKYKWIGCMYGVPKRICETIPEHQQMVIIEMLNKSPGGEILGFGLIKNYTRTDKHTKIYNDNRFNKYLYNSSHRIECGVVKGIDKLITTYQKTDKKSIHHTLSLYKNVLDLEREQIFKDESDQTLTMDNVFKGITEIYDTKLLYVIYNILCLLEEETVASNKKDMADALTLFLTPVNKKIREWIQEKLSV